MDSDLVTCRQCGRALPVSAFYVRSRGAGRRAGQLRHPCKECTNETGARYYAAHPEQKRESLRRFVAANPDRMALLIRRSELRRKYGVSLEEYDALAEKQGHVCAICGQQETAQEARYLAVDHCHRTGEVRGLLCRSCNSALGLLDDDPERVRAVLRYLEQAASRRRHSSDHYSDATAR